MNVFDVVSIRKMSNVWDKEIVLDENSEAVAVLPWSQGDLNQGEVEQHCPVCNIGGIRWFQVGKHQLTKLCNNLMCDYPLGKEGEICIVNNVDSDEYATDEQTIMCDCDVSQPNENSRFLGEASHELDENALDIAKKYLDKTNSNLKAMKLIIDTGSSQLICNLKS